MTTPRKSEISKAAGAFRRAFVQLQRALPATIRQHWLTILFPIRLIPSPVALALIALFALAMYLNPSAEVASIGGQDVPPLACEEDELIGFVGIPDLLVCIHHENVSAASVATSTAIIPTPTPAVTVGAPSVGMPGLATR